MLALNAAQDNLASSKSRRFWLLTWLRFVLASLITVLLSLLYGADKGSDALSPAGVAALYTLTSLTALWGLYYAKLPWEQQLFGQLLVDVVLIALLVSSLGGGAGGYAILFMMPIAASASLLSWTTALLICSISVIALLVDGLRRALLNNVNVDWVLLGLLGFTGYALMAILRFTAQRTENIEEKARVAHTQAQMVQELSEQQLTEDTVGWLVLDENCTVRLLNSPTRNLAWQAGYLLEAGKTITAESPLAPWLVALKHSSEISIQWPTQQAKQDAQHTVQLETLHIKSSALPSLNGLIALTLELGSTRLARTRDMHLAAMGRLSASIAHEIRNPLAAISQAAELLQESKHLTGADEPLLAMVMANTARIDRIVHNLLAWSRGANASPVVFHPHTLVAQLAQQIGVGLGLKPDQLSIEPALAALGEVQFDEDHVYQILSNLLSNAARYASGAPSSIHLAFKPRGRFVTLLVLDDGPPVAATVAAHLFEPFQTASKQGTGLGLFLCREYAQANQGGLQLLTRSGEHTAGSAWVSPPYTKAFALNMPLTGLN